MGDNDKGRLDIEAAFFVNVVPAKEDDPRRNGYYAYLPIWLKECSFLP